MLRLTNTMREPDLGNQSWKKISNNSCDRQIKSKEIVYSTIIIIYYSLLFCIVIICYLDKNVTIR